MLATLITRVFQLIFAIIVLGLSIRAAKWQRHDSVPATTSYNAFAGALTAIVAIIGIAAIWFSAIPSLIMSGLDGVTALLLLAGGIAYAVKITGIDCGTTVYDYHNAISNPILNGGCQKIKGTPYCGYDSLEQIAGRCKVVEADTAFLFFGFAASVGAAVLCFLAHKRGSTV